MNNILSLFHGYLGLLMDDKKLDPATVAGLARIKEGARAASELMDRTKVLARPSSVVWREINVQEMLKRMESELESLCDRGVKLKVNVPENLPPIWADMSRLKTAILEVVKNACEASPPSETVEIDVLAESQPTTSPTAAGKAAQKITWVSISVTDCGGGIAPELHEKIFHPFFTTKQKQNAVGLGLTMALGLVQQLGGTVRFQTKPGETTFRLLLPSRAKVV